MRNSILSVCAIIAGLISPSLYSSAVYAGDAPSPAATVIASFPGGNGGAGPRAAVIADPFGNLYGTTFEGGQYGRGTVYKIDKTQSGHASTPTILANFGAQPNCADGCNPWGGLLADRFGNLYGTTLAGGAHGGGTVYKINRTPTGYDSTPVILVSFGAQPNCANGCLPWAGLVADLAGNLYGTTFGGGAHNGGTVFAVAKTPGGYASTPTTLVSFCARPNCADGSQPQAGLILDAFGNLYGTTTSGGAYGFGTVFRIERTRGAYASSPSTLVSFCQSGNSGTCPDGAGPLAGLIADPLGNLYGTTSGGGSYGRGVVYKIAKTLFGYANTPTTLVSFCAQPNCADGSQPWAPLVADAVGNLYGTTPGGGNGIGTVFKVAKNQLGGYASAPITLVAFDNDNGQAPFAGLIADAFGRLYGTAAYGGVNNFGTVYKVTNSGFVVGIPFSRN